jgi:hypothetical protein
VSARDVRYYAMLTLILGIGLLAWRFSLPWMVRSDWIAPSGIIFSNRWKLVAEWAATLSLVASLGGFAWTAMREIQRCLRLPRTRPDVPRS